VTKISDDILNILMIEASIQTLRFAKSGTRHEA